MPMLPTENASVEIPAREAPFYGKRTIKVYLTWPGGDIRGVNADTGLFLTLHNWGGTVAIGTVDPLTLAERCNVAAIAVDYLQSGAKSPPEDGKPYDFGFFQALDALWALYYVYNGLERQKIAFDKTRIYSVGGSGGGNVTLMANKLAPRTFAAIAEFSGVVRLTDDIAYGLPGGSNLNAGYSQDPRSPNYLTKDAQQIRYVGCPRHLRKMKALGNDALVFVFHGKDDGSCLVVDTKTMVRNMRQNGFEVDACFISAKDVDGKLIRDSGHSLGNRTELFLNFAAKYFSPTSPDVRRNARKNDFESKDNAVEYEMKNGRYVISYEKGFPVESFIPKSGRR